MKKSIDEPPIQYSSIITLDFALYKNIVDEFAFITAFIDKIF